MGGSCSAWKLGCPTSFQDAGIRHIAEILPACGRQNGGLCQYEKMPSGAAATPHLEKVWGMCGLFFRKFVKTGELLSAAAWMVGTVQKRSA